VECHRFDATSFAESPTPEDCQRRSLDEIVAPEGGHIGSYTGAFPPDYVERAPECINPFGDVNAGGAGGSGDLERTGAGLGGGGGSSFFGDSGCRTAPGGAGPAALFLVGLSALALAARRRAR
jgi:hypothetical protein